jgi:hypothetical protein
VDMKDHKKSQSQITRSKRLRANSKVRIDTKK